MKLSITIPLVLFVALGGCYDENTSSGTSTSEEDADEIVGVSPVVVEADDNNEVDTLDPNKILFSTPTLNDAIPTTVEGGAIRDGCIQLHEDDWRQFELVSAGLKPEVDAELLDIIAIWDNHSVPLGNSGTAFREVHVRKRLPMGLDVEIPLSEFELLVGGVTQPMTFYGYGEVLCDVHAARIDNLIIYAHVTDRSVTSIGLHVIEQFSLPTDFAVRFREFLLRHDLMLVHWRSRTLFESSDDVLGYLGIRRQ
jgi:hypothetical protein